MKISLKRQERDLSVEDKSQIPRWLFILMFLLPVLIYIPGIMGKIPFPSESALYTDLMLTHYPNALVLRNSIHEFQQIPLWSSLTHSGAPFAANPLAGLFYIPGWLALLFPLPEGISIILAAHAVFGSWGMYRFLKEEFCGEMGAIAGGLVFGLMPKLAAHYGAGHVTLIYSISWTPWLFLISKQDKQGWKTGIIAALLFLADPRWAIYAGIFWLSFDIAHRKILEYKTYSLYYLKAGLTSFLIASPLIIPLYEYVRLSTRSRMGIEDIQEFSLPPQKILGLIIPVSTGSAEWFLYAGGVVMGLFFLQMFFRRLRIKNKFWNIWIVIAILISLGSFLINPSWLVRIPIISLIRVPARALFLLGFSFSVISARSIDELTYKDFSRKNISIISFGLAVFSLAMALSITYFIGYFSIRTIWGFGFLFIFSLYLIIKKPESGIKNWAWIVIGLIVIDLTGAGIQSYYIKDKEFKDSSEIMATIIKDQEIFRLYSPSYSIPQYIAAENGFQLADGVDPMQLSTYSDFMVKASGVKAPGYSVTIPPFPTGNPSVDNIAALPDPFLLSLLNVKYLVSEFEINGPDLQEVITEDQNYIYKNNYLSERAWVEEVPKTKGNYRLPDHGRVYELSRSPNRIYLTADGPGRLVLSEIYYPGWKVYVDGDQQTLELAYGLLRSVNLPEGEHKVEFMFHPMTVYGGIGLAIIGWFLALWKILRKNHD